MNLTAVACLVVKRVENGRSYRFLGMVGGGLAQCFAVETLDCLSHPLMLLLQTSDDVHKCGPAPRPEPAGRLSQLNILYQPSGRWGVRPRASW